MYVFVCVFVSLRCFVLFVGWHMLFYLVACLLAYLSTCFFVCVRVSVCVCVVVFAC